ncbi:glyoxalase [Candidatus Uhrbacteria bacterium CG_4_9_14_3_um_filter_36_7]|uniref:Glyoxalase n=1 Tax=Candidatus Uhrbacteria bacterium CG_4_9_14_3_um_filter_36_7 TaxID=1975033 RepID=A0A2M7XIC1_9BACT|nr:MAG: glyoxalase [Candidatus Uhrbacteria bacterium CG_4_9_14_3_um_filter_36_7]
MNPIVHFEIPADDIDRAIEFYTKTFGWQINKFDMPSEASTEGNPYYVVITTEVDDKKMPTKPGTINGGLMKRVNPGHVFTNYIQVDSIEQMLQDISINGGTIVMPKTEIAPAMGWIAMFKDTEDNLMGLYELTNGM